MPRPHYERISPRLKNFDYSSNGPYFVTICTYQRQSLFNEIALRRIVETTWQTLPDRYPSLQLDEFVVMPDHVHFIIWLDAASTDSATTVRVSLPRVVQAYKSLVAVAYLRWIGEHDPSRSGRVWQRGYFERIIPNEESLAATRQYIRNNPKGTPTT